jgi:hypothetical protein
MTQINKVHREVYGLTIAWSVVAISTFFLVVCPDFVDSTLRGEFQPSLIGQGINQRLNILQQLLGGSQQIRNANRLTHYQLFGEADQLGPGAIAIGHAEGTLTSHGKPTWAYYGHSDPANKATNKGFASWQATPVKTVAEADQNAISRIKNQCIPYTVKSFQAQDLTLTPRLLVESCDIWIQAPRAAVDFAWNYKQCRQKGRTGETALLCARINNYINPVTGRFDVAAIFRNPGRLETDQKRRMQAIARTLKRFNVSLSI